MAKMTDDKLLSIMKSEFKSAMGTPGKDLSKQRALAMDRYLQKPMGNEVEGESEVMTSDVADVVDGVMPSMLRLFTTADNLVSFDPVGPEDQGQADQESDYTQHVFFKEQKDPGSFMIMWNWFFDALLQKNGIVMAWWDTSEKVSYESFQDLSIVEVDALLQDPELEPLERSSREDEASGEELHSIRFRRVQKAPGRVKVVNVPPDEYRISSDVVGLDPCGARMVGRERNMTRSDLISMGFDPKQVADLPAVDATGTESPEQRARRDKTDDQGTNASDKSQEKVCVREAYLKVDYDGDGKSELRQVFTGGDQLLRWKDGGVANEPVDRQPFHVICPGPLPHKHFGQSWAEKVIENQDTSTTLLRQVLNNLYRTNSPQHGVWENGMSENTLDDLLSNRVGQVVRFGRPVGESYAPLTVPFTAGATFPMLEYFDKVKRERTGVHADGEGLNPESLKNIQQSVLASSVDMSKMKLEAVARIFAETGIRSLFEHIHELLLKHQDKPKLVRLRNNYVPVDPRQWRARENVTINIGLGIGTRDQNLLHLNAIWEKQVQIIQGGGQNLVVTPKNIFNTASEIVKNANYKTAEMFFTDPGNQLAPPPADEAQELAKKEAELEERRQMLDAQRNAINEAKIKLEAHEQQLNHERKIMELEERAQEREDKYAYENEKMRTELAKLIAEKQERGEKLPLELRDMMERIEYTRAQTTNLQAQTAKVLEEARAQDIENDATETGATELLESLSAEETD